jgi:hypothetical protein
MRRLQVHLNPKEVMRVHRRILKERKVVYLLVAKSPVKYRGGRSQIVYIGTTRKGVDRISGSAAHHAEEIMAARGIKFIDVFVVSCSSRSGLPTWEWLEDALLAEFRAEYEELPKCNDQGKKLKWNKKLDKMFKRKAVDRVFTRFDPSK